MHEGAGEAAGARAIPAAAAPNRAKGEEQYVTEKARYLSDGWCFTVFSVVFNFNIVFPSGRFLQKSCVIRLTETNTFVSKQAWHILM